MPRKPAVECESWLAGRARTRLATLCGLLLALSGTRALAAPPDPGGSDAPSVLASPSPPPTPPAIDMSGTIERAVRRVLDDAEDPCALARREGKPCFSASVTMEDEGPTVSVARDLRNWRADPDAAPVEPLRSPLGTPLGGVSFDPVCSGKLLLRKLRGKNTTFYLYRVWDRNGERAALRETEMTPSAGPTEPDSGYVLVRKVSGECKALSAYAKLNREARERNARKAASVPPR